MVSFLANGQYGSFNKGTTVCIRCMDGWTQSVGHVFGICPKCIEPDDKCEVCDVMVYGPGSLCDGCKLHFETGRQPDEYD